MDYKPVLDNPVILTILFTVSNDQDGVAHMCSVAVIIVVDS